MNDLKVVYPKPHEVYNELINEVKEYYLSWLKKGKHAFLGGSIYEDRGWGRKLYHYLEEKEMNQEEMIQLYPTLKSWMEEEYTGDTFYPFPKYENEIYNLIEEFLTKRTAELSGIDNEHEQWDEWMELYCEENVEIINEVLGIIGEIQTSEIAR